MNSELELELLEIREKITWFKCIICGNIFSQSNNNKTPVKCLLCYGDINRKQQVLEELEMMHGKRPYPESEKNVH